MSIVAPDMYRVKLGPQGRLVVPVELRRELGIEPGDQLVAFVENGKLIVQTREETERELLAMFEGMEGSMSEELIRERREEARREAERGY
jgi:AbrB family looped-hinge helix DNA binding protein